MRCPDPASTDGFSGDQRIGARDAAVQVSLRLIEHGFVAYFAGGCVRDELMGLTPIDFDIATNAPPQEIAKIFRGAHGVGEAFGVMLVHWKGRILEVATFRCDGEYLDGRRPAEVRFATAQEDAQRRDFTINGLFRHPTTGEVIDFVSGQRDLQLRILRAIGNPAARLAEDRLRALRAVRFAARFNLTIDPSTEEAICDSARDLGPVSRERIGGEFRRMFTHVNRATAVQLIERWGLDAPSLGEPSSRGATLRVAALPEKAEFATVLAAWRLDRIERTTAPSGSQWRDQLNLSGHEWRDYREILETVEVLRTSWIALSTAGKRRLAARGTFASSLDVFRGEDSTRCDAIAQTVAVFAQECGGIAPPPLVNGADLIALGFAPGPQFRQILDRIYDAQLEGVLITKDQAMLLARTEMNG